MMNDEILAILGVGEERSPYYARIAEWDSWWRGFHRPFHEFAEGTASGPPVRRQLYRMNMAKKICEDWAALLLNDKTAIRVDDEVGETFLKTVLDSTDFAAGANRLLEKAFATGTGAAILRFAASQDEEGGWYDPAGVSFEYVDAAHIIPLSVEGGVITEAAFVSESLFRGEERLYVEVHTKEEDGYVIRNTLYRREDGALVPVKDGSYEHEIRTGSPVPLFAILTPNIQDPVDGNCGLGVSVYADAIDCLKGVDLAFNNFCRDIRLGGKKVFLNQTLVRRDEDGAVFTPDDVAQQLFVTIGDSDLSEHPMITEHNPELRAAENAEAVQCQLNYLAFRCGLGAHHYDFSSTNGRTKLTATQYMGERQDMRQNAVKHQKNVTVFLRAVARAVLWIGSAVYGFPIRPDAAVSVWHDDAYFVDAETVRSRDLAEVEAGLMTAEEYRDKWKGGSVLA